MRIAYVIDSLGSGGAQRQIVGLAAALVERREISARFAVYHDEDFFSPELREAGIATDRLPKRGMLDPLFPRRLRAWLRRHPADLVHASLLAPSIWSRLAVRGLAKRGRPSLLVSERSSLIGTSLIESLLQKFAYRGADAVTANAATVALEIEQKLGVPNARIHYIPNGIDLEAWDREALRLPSIELAPGYFHVALVGSLVPSKNSTSLIRAVARIPKALRKKLRVWLIGHHEEVQARATLREVEGLGLSDVVKLVPPQREVAAIIVRLGAVVLPSLFEGFPNAVLEAMASRTPVIATPVGDVPNLIEHGKTGLLVRVGDDEALAESLLWMLRASDAERGAMGSAARRTVETKFQMSALADAHLALYRSLAR